MANYYVTASSILEVDGVYAQDGTDTGGAPYYTNGSFFISVATNVALGNLTEPFTWFIGSAINDYSTALYSPGVFFQSMADAINSGPSLNVMYPPVNGTISPGPYVTEITAVSIPTLSATPILTGSGGNIPTISLSGE